MIPIWAVILLVLVAFAAGVVFEAKIAVWRCEYCNESKAEFRKKIGEV